MERLLFEIANVAKCDLISMYRFICDIAYIYSLYIVYYVYAGMHNYTKLGLIIYNHIKLHEDYFY